MENFEPLNASGTNDMVELWPSEISTLRISLWISPYGILPRIPKKQMNRNQRAKTIVGALGGV